MERRIPNRTPNTAGLITVVLATAGLLLSPVAASKLLCRHHLKISLQKTFFITFGC